MKEKTKKSIKENIHNIPNFLTLLRGLGAVLLVYFIFANYSKITIFFVFIALALTDLFDGEIARRFNLRTKFGKYFDVVVDRIFMISFVAAVIIKFGIINNDLIFKLLPLIMTREIIAAPFWIFVRKFDARVNVKRIGKTTTLMQSITVPAVLIGLNAVVLYIFIVLTAIIGIFSGITYAKDWKKEKKNHENL